jgi:hypothetical protein
VRTGTACAPERSRIAKELGMVRTGTAHGITHGRYVIFNREGGDAEAAKKRGRSEGAPYNPGGETTRSPRVIPLKACKHAFSTPGL